MGKIYSPRASVVPEFLLFIMWNNEAVVKRQRREADVRRINIPCEYLRILPCVIERQDSNGAVVSSRQSAYGWYF